MTAVAIRSHSVLVVDDDSLIRWSLNQRFTEDGYRVLEASSAWDAVERLAAESHRGGVDVMVLDFLLPGGGFPFIDWLGLQHPRVRLILMTSLALADIQDYARARGVPIVLEKPFDVALVSKVIEEVMAA